MSFNDVNGVGGSGKLLQFKAGESHRVRLLFVPGHPKFGDLCSWWGHSLYEYNPQGENGRGQWRGYEKCLGQGLCPMCVNRQRFPSAMRHACNVLVLDTPKPEHKVLVGGTQIWNPIGAIYTAYNKDVSCVDFIITRPQAKGGQYTVIPMANQAPIQFNEADLIDIDAVDELQAKSMEQIQMLIQQLNMPVGNMGGMAAPPQQFGMQTQQPQQFGAPAPMQSYGQPQQFGAPQPGQQFGAPAPMPMQSYGPPPAMPNGQFGQSGPVGDMGTPGPSEIRINPNEAVAIVCPTGKYPGKTVGDIVSMDRQYATEFSTGLPAGLLKSAFDMALVNMTSVPTATVHPPQAPVDERVVIGTAVADKLRKLDTGSNFAELASYIKDASNGRTADINMLTVEELRLLDTKLTSIVA